jgi:histidinol-phosphate aminotransferase
MPPTPTPIPTPRAAAAKAYTPPPPVGPDVLRLDANEGPAPTPEALAALCARLTPDTLRRYPDTRALEHALAARFNISPDRVLVTAGGDEAIDRVCRAYLEPGRELILPSPSFEMIRTYAALAGATTIEVPWWTPTYPLDPVLAAITPRTAVIAVVSPNNPTGATATAADLRALAAAAPNAVLLVDAAYAEFADNDLTPAALERPSAIVIRTLSKAWGLAGLRVGYALGNPDLIARLRAVAGPFPVAATSLALAAQRLATGQADVDRTVALVRREREELARLLTSLGAAPLPSQGNFITARFAAAASVHAALLARGVSVRRFSSPALSEHLRITCPASPADFSRLSAALTQTLTETRRP